MAMMGFGPCEKEFASLPIMMEYCKRIRPSVDTHIIRISVSLQVLKAVPRAAVQKSDLSLHSQYFEERGF